MGVDPTQSDLKVYVRVPPRGRTKHRSGLKCLAIREGTPTFVGCSDWNRAP